MTTTNIPTAAEIFARYLAATPTDKKGHKYVFSSDGENGGEAPDHFRLAECVFTDNGLDDQDEDVSEAVHAACESAEDLWTDENTDEDEE